MSKKKAYGWVIEDTEDHCYLRDFCPVGCLKDAKVYLTRAEARGFKTNCLSGDVIRRVSLSCSGKAVVIVSGR